MLNDLVTALRALRRAPGFVAAAVLTLALGIGATTAIFTVVDAMLLRPLPYADAQRLVTVWSHVGDPTAEIPPSYPDFADWRAAASGPGRPLQDVAFARSEGLLLRGTESAASVNVAFVSDGFFRVLGGRPLLGRTFRADEERAGAARVLVLGHRLWRTRFAGDPTVIGRTLDFAEGSYTVVGVMPVGYEYPGRWAEAWAPLAPLAALTPSVRQRLERRDLRVDARVIGRLAPNGTPETAALAVAAAARRLAADFPGENARWGAHLTPLREQLIGGVRRALLVLLAAVGLLLLVACADVANLSLVRASARERELAVRAALGAGRTRLLRQLFAESLVVALAGGALGIGVAWSGIALLPRFAPDSPRDGTSVPRLDAVHMDLRVLGFAMLIAVGTAIIFGLAPAVHALRGAASRTLRDGTRAVSGGMAGRRFRDGVTVVQIALTLVLLVGAGLLGRSFLAIRAQQVGYPIERLVVLRIEPLAARYDTPQRLLALYDRVRTAASAIPGARAAAIVNHLAMTGAAVGTPIKVAGGPDSLGAVFRVADGAYFAATGIPIQRGRALVDDDMRRAEQPNAVDVPAVVSADLARDAWRGADPIGRRFTAFKQASGRPDFGQPIAAIVVGVASDVKLGSLTETTPVPAVYLPMTVNPWRWGHLVVRASGDPATLVAAVRAAVRSVDPDLPVADVVTGASIVAESLQQQRFDLVLVIVFAGAALVLAAIGVYGVVAQGVSLRSGELAMRAALGAAPGRLLSHVLGGGAKLAAGGIVAGVVLSLGATRLLGSLLFGVGARDAVTYAAVAGLLALVALAASFVPARRAARTDPVAVLRGD